MKTIALRVDDDLLQAVDTTIKVLHTSRSAFMREALRLLLQGQHIAALEERHRQGYVNNPVIPGEFSDWEDEQAWGDA